MIQDWKDPVVAKEWDAKGHRTNPERAEQLAILLHLLCDLCPQESIILDLGFGSGQVDAMLLAARSDWSIVGIDNSPAMMQLARERLADSLSRVTMLSGDLSDLAALTSTPPAVEAVIAVQSLHHLGADSMKAAYRWVHQVLKPGGWFFLLDRVRMSDAHLWPAYQSAWRRLDALHHSTLLIHEGDTPESHEQELARRQDRPVTIAEHLSWLTSAGFAADVLHAHANRALIVSCKRS